jgi:sRNA-binding carbon storage regulator CsrA
MANGFLVIERQKDESITIFDDDSTIEIMVCDVRGNHGNERIKLGIKASEKYKIHRTESCKKH